MPENNITFGFTIHYADCCGNAKNCTYPHTATATTEEEIRNAPKVRVARESDTLVYKRDVQMTTGAREELL